MNRYRAKVVYTIEYEFPVEAESAEEAKKVAYDDALFSFDIPVDAVVDWTVTSVDADHSEPSPAPNPMAAGMPSK